MRLLVATGSFGGPVTYSRLLEGQLPSHGIKVEVVSFGEVLHLPKIVRHVAYFLKLVRRGVTCHLIYAQDPVSVGLPAYAASLLIKKPFYLKVVGDYAWEQAQARYGVTDSLDVFVTKSKTYALRIRVLCFIERFVARNAKKIIVPSRYLKKIVTAWGVTPQKIEVIYNAYNEPTIVESKETLRAIYEYTYPTIVSAGRLVPWKEFPTLIHSFKELLNEYKEAKLYIIDDGPERRKLLDLTRELGIEERVIFTGKIAQTELHKRIKAADLFVLASSYEGFSHVLLEALSLGTPVITSTEGGNPELVEHGRNGLLVASHNISELTGALKKLCGDTMLQTQFATAGKRTLEQFREEDMLTKLITVLS